MKIIILLLTSSLLTDVRPTQEVNLIFTLVLLPRVVMFTLLAQWQIPMLMSMFLLVGSCLSGTCWPALAGWAHVRRCGRTASALLPRADRIREMGRRRREGSSPSSSADDGATLSVENRRAVLLTGALNTCSSWYDVGSSPLQTDRVVRPTHFR